MTQQRITIVFQDMTDDEAQRVAAAIYRSHGTYDAAPNADHYCTEVTVNEQPANV